MSTRARVCAWMAGLGLILPSPATAQDRTERDVVDLIVRDGPQASVIRLESEATRRDQLARLTSPNPGVLYSREGAGFTEFLQMEQVLPVTGVRGALSRAAGAAIAAAEAERDARLWTLRADAASAVARVVIEQQRLQVAGSHAASIERLIAVLRVREREGEGSRLDRVRAELELRDARQMQTSAALAAADARAVVSALLPRDTAVGRIVGSTDPQQPSLPLDHLLARALSSRADLRALERLGERSLRESDAARRARLPAPSVFGGLKRADDATRREHGGVFGVTVSLPLFDRGGRDVARWAAEGARVNAERVAVEARIRAEITQASESLALLQQALSGEDVAAGDELMEIAEVAYREGEIGILELLDSVRTASRARLRVLESRLGARLAQIAVERAAGDVLWP